MSQIPLPAVEMTLADAARKFHLSYSALNYRALALGIKPVRRVADRRLFSEAQIQQLIEAVTTGHVAIESAGEIPLGGF